MPGSARGGRSSPSPYHSLLVHLPYLFHADKLLMQCSLVSFEGFGDFGYPLNNTTIRTNVHKMSNA
jgi:hypothetical protein